MKRTLTITLVVAAAFAFTLLMMYVGGWPTGPRAVSYVCIHLIWPGMAITVDLLHRPLLGDNFFPLTLFFNTLIYSGVFGLLLWLRGRLRKSG
jgi:hypothetical protein